MLLRARRLGNRPGDSAVWAMMDRSCAWSSRLVKGRSKFGGFSKKDIWLPRSPSVEQYHDAFLALLSWKSNFIGPSFIDAQHGWCNVAAPRLATYLPPGHEGSHFLFSILTCWVLTEHWKPDRDWSILLHTACMYVQSFIPLWFIGSLGVVEGKPVRGDLSAAVQLCGFEPRLFHDSRWRKVSCHYQDAPCRPSEPR